LLSYAVKKDEFCSGLLVVFGTEAEIAEGTICGGHGDVDAFQTLQTELQDSGELCEDYLIVSERFTDEAQISEIESIIEAHGFAKNMGLLNCGWS
jgi:hypothetical protein